MDAQILAIWQALRVNPDLDAHCALRAVDQLLDQRASPGADGAESEPLRQASGSPGALTAGSPIQLAILAEILETLL
jgi:hypothetical protein